jgi:hypothetical protein
MILTTFTDPGVIPQNISGYEIEEDNFEIPKNKSERNYLIVK